MKKAGIVIGAIIGLFIIVIGGFTLKIKSETDSMTPAATGLVAPGIFAVQDDFTNFFLIQHGDKYIAIDTGNDPEIVRQELSKLSIGHDRVDAVFLTHSDFDHVASVGDFVQASV
jgi:glyoxylase-like metal-dependent hydrolase (beta-lactamase superfamily II)